MTYDPKEFNLINNEELVQQLSTFAFLERCKKVAVANKQAAYKIQTHPSGRKLCDEHTAAVIAYIYEYTLEDYTTNIHSIN